MVQHAIGARVQKCPENSLTIPNGLASSCRSVQLCISKHNGKKNPTYVWKEEGLNCANPPQGGTGDAASGGRLCILMIRLFISSPIWLPVFALSCKKAFVNLLFNYNLMSLST